MQSWSTLSSCSLWVFGSRLLTLLTYCVSSHESCVLNQLCANAGVSAFQTDVQQLYSILLVKVKHSYWAYLSDWDHQVKVNILMVMVPILIFSWAVNIGFLHGSKSMQQIHVSGPVIKVAKCGWWLSGSKDCSTDTDTEVAVCFCMPSSFRPHLLQGCTIFLCDSSINESWVAVQLLCCKIILVQTYSPTFSAADLLEGVCQQFWGALH